jgi:sugar lactone lactonase YvrE
MISVHDAELVLDYQAELGEGPVWDAEASRLWFVDILRGRVHRFDPATSALETFEVGCMVGAVAPAEDGNLVLAVHDGFARFDPITQRLTMIADVEADRPDQRMNDGKCDAAGRFWAGTMALDERDGAGALYRLDPGGQTHRMLRHVSISNGLDWSDDGRLMYFVDSPTQSIDVFDFDLAAGTIANRRSLLRIGPAHGMPDGLTLDAAGYIWVSLWGGGGVRRYAPDGTLDSIIRLPTTYPTSCTFGGPDFRDLYITTATIRLSDSERVNQPQAGGLFRCRPAVGGRPPSRFKG